MRKSKWRNVAKRQTRFFERASRLVNFKNEYYIGNHTTMNDCSNFKNNPMDMKHCTLWAVQCTCTQNRPFYLISLHFALWQHQIQITLLECRLLSHGFMGSSVTDKY